MDLQTYSQIQEFPPLYFGDPIELVESKDLRIAPDYVTIILCKRGRKTIRLNLMEYILEPGSFVVILPDVIWRSISESDDFQALYISVKATNEDRRKAQIVNVDLSTIFSFATYIIRFPHTFLDSQEIQVMEEYIELLRHRYESRADSTLLIALLSVFFMELNQIFARRVVARSVKITRKEEMLGEFLHLLKLHYKMERSVEFYADKMCVSPKHLSSVVKQLSGHTAHEIIVHVVVMEAKRLLKTTTKTVQEISDELNFANQSFFGKFFKQHTGQSPSAYRVE